MVSVRSFLAFIILLYGISIPFFANNFFINNSLVAIYAILSCIIISLLLYSGKVLLFNLAISFYILKQYLTLPYVDILNEKLTATQLDYILGNHYYYSSEAAEVVYLSLLSLLIAWSLGIFIMKPMKSFKPFYPWVFREIDNIITTPTWRFWLVFVSLYILNYTSIDKLWLSMTGVEPSVTFAYGMVGTSFITLGCLAHFVYSKHFGSTRVHLTLLLPIIFSSISDMLSGGRGALLIPIIFLLIIL